jgi:hypothetical protein
MVEDFAFNALTQSPIFELSSHNAEFESINTNYFQPDHQIGTKSTDCAAATQCHSTRHLTAFCAQSGTKTKGPEGMTFGPWRTRLA